MTLPPHVFLTFFFPSIGQKALLFSLLEAFLAWHTTTHTIKLVRK